MTPQAFQPDAARALPGPAWLQSRRVTAAEGFEATGLPTPQEEVWRYSRIDDLDLGRYQLLHAAPAEGSEYVPEGIEYAALVVVSGGWVLHHDVSPEAAAAGVFVGRLLERPDAAELLGSVMCEPTDALAALNDAFARDPVGIDIPPGVHLARPIVVVHLPAPADTAAFPRLVVRVGESGSAAVLDQQLGGDGASLVVPVVEMRVERAAHLRYANVQQLGRAAWQIGSQVAEVAEDATLVASTAGLGGDYARIRTDCRLTGRGGTGNLVSLYFGEGEQTLDFRTFQDHRAPDTTSNLLFKGAVGDRSKSVYTGLIRVEKNARGTNAFQTNRNIKLSDDAWAESVPNLEIENNEVRCSHASSIGPIDPDQRFYLESRGVPPRIAERLVVAGFFADVLEQFAVPEAVPGVRAAIADKLEAANG